MASLTTSFAYEPQFNQLASVTDPLQHMIVYGYTQGKFTSITNAIGKTWTITPDSSGRPLSITSPSPISAMTQFGYTGADLTTITDPLNRVTTRVPDGAGRLTGLTTALGNVTHYSYDPVNRVTQITDALQGLTAFGYDANGNLLSVTDAKNHATTYTYDTMDRLATRADALTRSEVSTYDAIGNVLTVRDRKNQTTTYAYDALNRRTQAVYADAATTTYTYDAGNRVTQVLDSLSGTITRTYDGLDRLLSENTPQGSVSYSYDNAGRRTGMTVAGQPQVTYTYDNANRLLTVTKGTNSATYSYDAAGRRTSLVLSQGSATSSILSAYDAASQLTSLTYQQGATTIGTLTYGYDAGGNRTAVGGTWARTGLPQPVATATYDVANEALTFAGTTLTSDANGNVTSAADALGAVTYTWDARNRLTGVSAPGLSASFAYDPLGRRTSKTLNGVTTTFIYDGMNPVQDRSGSTITNRVTGLGIDEYLFSDSAYFLTDALGSTIALTDTNGTLQTDYTYEPFGNTSVTGAASTNALQYTGRENDGATGLVYYRARYYSPRLQRFASEDPLLCGGTFAFPMRSVKNDPQSLNMYAYVSNRPLILRDPLGLSPECQYYEMRCSAYSGKAFYSPAKFYYCSAATTVCENTPNENTTNCIRQCLQAYDYTICMPTYGRKDEASALCSAGPGHAYCITKCVSNGF